jgi:hypothetical protein
LPDATAPAEPPEYPHHFLRGQLGRWERTADDGSVSALGKGEGNPRVDRRIGRGVAPRSFWRRAESLAGRAPRGTTAGERRARNDRHGADPGHERYGLHDAEEVGGSVHDLYDPQGQQYVCTFGGFGN